MNRALKYSLIFLVLILGVVIRVAVFYAVGQPINSCSALWGILARDASSLNVVPVSLSGVPFIGAIGVYLEFIFLTVLRLNPFTNGAADLTFSVLFIISSYLLGKELFGKIGAVISLTLSACSPYLVVISSVTPCANYQAVLFFQNIIFLMAYKIMYSSTKTPNIISWVVLGFVSGIALWSNFAAISCILTVLIFLNIKHHRIIFTKCFLLGLIFFLIGSCPFWLKDKTVVFDKIQWISLDVDFYNRLADAAIYKIPAILGFGQINVLAMALYLTAFLYAINVSRYGFINITKISLPDKKGLELLLSFLILTVIMLSRFKLYDFENSNDFITVYPVFILFIVRLLIDIKQQSKFIFIVIYSAFVIANMINVSSMISEKRVSQLLEKKTLDELVFLLKSESIDFIYTDNVSPNIINFLSNGIIKNGAYINEQKEYLKTLNSITKSALILRRKNGLNILSDLKSMGLGDNIKIIGDIAVLYPFTDMSDYRGIEIPTAKWRTASNFNSEDTYKAWDRDIFTRWTSNKLQDNGMFYELDLSKQELIDKITVIFNPDKYDYPRALKVEFSNDRKNWDCIIDVSNNTMDLLFGGDYPFLKDFNIKFVPKRVRFIKFIQTWASCQYYWSIREIFVYGSSYEKS